MINGKPHVIDPLTGKFEDATKYKVAVDHILPKSYFTKDSRFSKLPKSVQNSIMNSPDNLQPMLHSANSSKGSKIEFNNSGWETWREQKVNSNYRKYLESIQRDVDQRLKEAYKQYNIK